MKNHVVVEAKTRKYHLRYRDSLTWAARINRKNETISEKILWNKLLRKQQLGYKFTRQKPIGRFIADFYCSELSLVIEIDGASHTFKTDRDKLRDEYLNSCGIKIIRVTNEDVLKNLDRVEKLIRACSTFSPVKGRIKRGVSGGNE